MEGGCNRLNNRRTARSEQFVPIACSKLMCWWRHRAGAGLPVARSRFIAPRAGSNSGRQPVRQRPFGFRRQPAANRVPAAATAEPEPNAPVATASGDTTPPGYDSGQFNAPGGAIDTAAEQQATVRSARRRRQPTAADCGSSSAATSQTAGAPARSSAWFRPGDRPALCGHPLYRSSIDYEKTLAEAVKTRRCAQAEPAFDLVAVTPRAGTAD